MVKIFFLPIWQNNAVFEREGRKKGAEGGVEAKDDIESGKERDRAKPRGMVNKCITERAGFEPLQKTG